MIHAEKKNAGLHPNNNLTPFTFVQGFFGGTLACIIGNSA